MEFRLIDNDRESYMNVLLIADPNEEVVMKYLDEGVLIGMFEEDKCIGISHYKVIDPSTAEIMNIGIVLDHQGRGWGKVLLDYTVDYAQDNGIGTLVLGTGNSSIGNIAFYQKSGFEMTEIWQNYFVDNYNEEIFENDIMCKHMIRFEKVLK